MNANKATLDECAAALDRIAATFVAMEERAAAARKEREAEYMAAVRKLAKLREEEKAAAAN